MPEPVVVGAFTRENDWWLGYVDDIPLGEGRAYRVGEVELAVFRTRAGALYATQARCPHRNGPLADGITGGATLVCPLHGFKFDLATGRSIGETCAGLRIYAVSTGAAGELFVNTAEPGAPA
jgi:nitrite reductase (NADH) small subunit